MEHRMFLRGWLHDRHECYRCRDRLTASCDFFSDGRLCLMLLCGRDVHLSRVDDHA